MKRRMLLALVVVGIVALGFFFAAPVFFFRDYTGTLLGTNGRVSIYHSAGCVVFGIGDTYVWGSGPIYAFKPGFSLGCLNPPLL